MTQPLFQCATWNIHRAKGTDGKVDPDRIADAIATQLAPIGLDLLALQEADGECPPHGRIVDVGQISRDTGLAYQHETPDLRWGPQSDGFLGTIVFLHPRFDVTHRDVIDLPGHCHRGAVVIEAQDGAVPFRVISAHLSLSQPLRIMQMRILGQYLFRRPPMQTVMLGDFNEWRPWGGLMFSNPVMGRRFYGPSVRTFPSQFALLPLDRILSDTKGSVTNVRAIKNAKTCVFSDHLPLVGQITITGE